MPKFYRSIFLPLSVLIILLFIAIFLFWKIETARIILFSLIGILLIFVVLGRIKNVQNKRRQTLIINTKENRRKAQVIGVNKKLSHGRILDLLILDDKGSYPAVCYADDQSIISNPGSEIVVYVDPDNKNCIYIPVEPKTKKSSNINRRTQAFGKSPMVYVSSIAGVLGVILSFLFITPSKQLISSAYHYGNSEQIWELYSGTSNLFNKTSYSYTIKVYSLPDGKKIKKIKRSISGISNISMTIKGENVWVIGSAYEERSFIDIYDANTFEIKKTLYDFIHENKKLNSGVSQLSYPFAQNNTDLMYGNSFDIPDNRIISLTTNQGEKAYIDIETGVFYNDLDSLLFDFCLGGYNWKDKNLNQMYFLAYTTNASQSNLYRIDMKSEEESSPIRVTVNNGNYGQSGQAFSNIEPFQLNNETFRSYTSNSNLKKILSNTIFYNAKIIYCDNEVVCIIHTDAMNKTHYISCYNHNESLIAQADLSKYETYQVLKGVDIKPYSDRSGSVIGFRIKYFGTLRFDLTTNSISYSGENLFHQTVQKNGFILLYKSDYVHHNLYYSDQPLDSCIRDYYLYEDNTIKDANYNIVKAHIVAPRLNLSHAKFLFKNNQLAIIMSLDKGTNPSARIIGVDKDGKYIFVIDESSIPNHEYLIQDIQGNSYYDYNLDSEVQLNAGQATIVLSQYGALSVDLSTGKVLWIHEIDLNRGS